MPKKKSPKHQSIGSYSSLLPIWILASSATQPFIGRVKKGWPKLESMILSMQKYCWEYSQSRGGAKWHTARHKHSACWICVETLERLSNRERWKWMSLDYTCVLKWWTISGALLSISLPDLTVMTLLVIPRRVSRTNPNSIAPIHCLLPTKLLSLSPTDSNYELTLLNLHCFKRG